MVPQWLVYLSLTYDGGSWEELFGSDAPILNRGIGGDTSLGVLRRMNQITSLKPFAVFLMIGTNDAQLIGYSPSDTARCINRILGKIRNDSPATRVYIQALLPSKAPKFVAWSEQTNALVATLADNQSVFFLDFHNAFLEHGVLASRLTRDGLHLSPDGYRLWKSSIEPIMSELLRKRGRVSGTEVGNGV